MLICPIPLCERQYPDGEKYCKVHGATLVPATEIESPPEGSQADHLKNLRAELKNLRAELTKRDSRIVELEKQLQTPRRPDTTESAEANSDDTETVPGAVEPPSVPHLVCVRGSLEGKRFDVPQKGMLIGRKKLYGEQGGISINNPAVSNPHAWVGIEEGKVVLRDKKSTNGTYLDDEAKKRVTEKELNPGDTFIIADQSVAKFEFRR